MDPADIRKMEEKKKEAALRRANNPKDLVPRPRKSLETKLAGAFATSTLTFPSTRPATMDFAAGKMKVTKGQLKRRGRKKGKGKGKKKRGRSSDDESSEEEDEGEQEEEDVIEDDVPR